MTIRSACYVACNECGEPAEITVEGAAVARRLAAKQGFVRFDGQDLCSRHAPAGVEPKEPREGKPNPAERSVSVFDILAEMKASGKENRTFGSKVEPKCEQACAHGQPCSCDSHGSPAACIPAIRGSLRCAKSDRRIGSDGLCPDCRASAKKGGGKSNA